MQKAIFASTVDTFIPKMIAKSKILLLVLDWMNGWFEEERLMTRSQ